VSSDFQINHEEQRPGAISIKEIVIISNDGREVDIAPLLIELNIFENMFSPTLSGNILLSDSQNLIATLPIIGDEYIRIKAITPGFHDEDEIFRTFKVYSITNRAITQDDRSQQYILNFCSSEAVLDNLQVISKTYSGRGDQIVSEIFLKYLNMARNVFGKNKVSDTKDSDDNTPLLILDETQNNIKFTSPSWTPIKCINWVLSKSIPKNNKGSSLLFWETIKNFIMASPEQMIQLSLDSNVIFEDYIHAPANIKISERNDTVLYKKGNLNRAYRIVESFDVDTSFNSLESITNGYYGSRLYNFNVDTKEVEVVDYDYINRFNDYSHLETITSNGGNPLFSQQTFRNPESLKIFYPKNPNLYSDTPSNVSEVAISTIQNRISLLNELYNYRVNISVMGRTDIETGMVCYFGYPNIAPKDESTKQEDATDEIMAGYYLIVSVRHRIMATGQHRMTLGLVRDSTKATL